MAKKAPRRTWTEEQKRAIVAERATASVEAICNKHNIWPNMLNSWTKKFGKPAPASEPARKGIPLLPETTLVMIGMENPKEATILKLPRNWARALIETFSKE